MYYIQSEVPVSQSGDCITSSQRFLSVCLDGDVLHPVRGSCLVCLDGDVLHPVSSFYQSVWMVMYYVQSEVPVSLSGW
jgi:hypothetical protein